MRRGSVYFSEIFLPDWEYPREQVRALRKYCLMVNWFPRQSYRTVVLGSSDKSYHPPRLPRPTEVVVGPSDGFPTWTIIDCRWVFSFPAEMFSPVDYHFDIRPPVMEQVEAALAVGLQISPGGP